MRRQLKGGLGDQAQLVDGKLLRALVQGACFSVDGREPQRMEGRGGHQRFRQSMSLAASRNTVANESHVRRGPRLGSRHVAGVYPASPRRCPASRARAELPSTDPAGRAAWCLVRSKNAGHATREFVFAAEPLPKMGPHLNVRAELQQGRCWASSGEQASHNLQPYFVLVGQNVRDGTEMP